MPSATNQYMGIVFDKIAKDRNYLPRVLKNHVQDIKEFRGSESKCSTSLAATVVAVVYRLLCWTTKGPGYDKDALVAAYDNAATNPATPRWLQADFLRLNHDSKYRFKRVTEEEEADPAVLSYHGFTMEDWNRAFMLLCWLVKQAKGGKMSELFKANRDQKLVPLTFQSAEKVKLSATERHEAQHAKDLDAAEYAARFSAYAEKIREDEALHGSTMVLANMIQGKDVAYDTVQKHVQEMLSNVSTYWRAANVGSMPVKELDQIINTWKNNIYPVVARELGVTRNSADDEYVVHGSISHDRVTQEQYAAKAQAVVEMIAVSLKPQDADDLSDKQYFEQADKLTKDYFARDQVIAGKPPPTCISLDKALEMFGLESIDDLRFNTENTRITRRSVTKVDNQDPDHASDDEEAVEDEILHPGFIFLIHQPVGLFPSLLFL